MTESGIKNKVWRQYAKRCKYRSFGETRFIGSRMSQGHPLCDYALTARCMQRSCPFDQMRKTPPSSGEEG